MSCKKPISSQFLIKSFTLRGFFSNKVNIKILKGKIKWKNSRLRRRAMLAWKPS